MRTAAQAVASALALARSGHSIRTGMCDHYVASYYGLAYSGYQTARSHFLSVPASERHGLSLPPAGALCFWAGGSRGAGHVALSVGGGRIASTDYPRSGRVGIVSLGSITASWGLTYTGWTDAFYGPQGTVRIAPTPVHPPPHPPPKPVAALHLSLLRVGQNNTDVLAYQRAIRVRNGLAKWNPSGATGYYGNETAAMTEHAYRDVLHLTGGDLSVPGPTLLHWLGFAVLP